MAQKYDNWIVCVGNGIKNVKWLKNVENGIIFEEMPSICGKSLKYNYDKWLSCVRNGLNKQKIAQKCLKWLNYVGNDFDLCQMP